MSDRAVRLSRERERLIEAVKDVWKEELSDMWSAQEEAERVVDHVLIPELASRERAAAEKAWGEGWCAGVSRFTQQTLPPIENPYRQEDRNGNG